MKYTIEDVNEDFYQDIIEKFKKSFISHVKILKVFNVDLQESVTSITKFCPVKREMVEYPYPLAYNIRMIYYFVTTNNEIAERDITQNLNTVIKLLNRHPWTEENDFELRHERQVHLKIGFLLYLADLKLRLLEGDNFSAVELGTMIGITGQGIVNRIKRDQLKAHKESNEWVIKNEDAKKVVLTASEGLI
ncbi:MAG: hypothetical protein ACOCRO_00720 [Halanaerobiales bacterium]